MGLEGTIRPHDNRTNAPRGCVSRLVAASLYNGRQPVPGGPKCVLYALRRGLDISRSADRKLVSERQDGSIRPRGQGGDKERRQAVLSEISGQEFGGTYGDRRYHAPRDHARRHGGRR